MCNDLTYTIYLLDKPKKEKEKEKTNEKTQQNNSNGQLNSTFFVGMFVWR